TKLIESEGIIQKVNDTDIDFISTGFSNLISDKTWIQKEGIWINIRFLEFAKDKLARSIYCKLVVDKELFLWDNNEINKGILFYKKMDFRISQLIFKFLTISQVLNAMFWFLLIAKFYEIDDEGNLVQNK
nr:hypothetical protein [Hydrococcus sp. Prado102]